MPKGLQGFQKGHKSFLTEKSKQAISRALKGRKPWNFGKKNIWTKEQLEHFSSMRKGSKNHFYGKKHTPESLKKMSEATKGRKSPMEGKKHTLETRKKMSLSKLGKTGQDANNWRGGKTEEAQRIRNSTQYAEWRKKVYERDGYTCVKCGDSTSGNLEADHIKQFAWYPELRLDVDNGRTLCIPCHRKVTIFMGNQHRKLSPSQDY